MQSRKELGGWIALLVAALVGTAVEPIAAQETGWLSRWRARNDRGNRYEGRIDIPVSGTAIELLSFVGQLEPFREDVELNVDFFLPTEEQLSCGPATPRTRGVQVEARELREDKLYYMESKNEASEWSPGEWNRFGPWDTAAVLEREGIPSSNLGVVVRLDKKPWTAVAPALVYSDAATAALEYYTVYLRPNANLSRIDYALYRCEGAKKVEVSRSTLAGNKIAGEPFAIRLDVSDLAEGPMFVRINGKVRNKSTEHAVELHLYHRPRSAEAG